MSSSPANRRSGAGSRRFNPLKALQQPKRRLQQMLAAQVAQRSIPLPLPPPSPSPSPSPSLFPSFDYCRFIELDYIPMETGGFMVSMRPTRGCLTQKSPERQPPRRSPAPVSSRDPYGNASLSSSSTSGSCKGSDCSPTHRRNVGGAKYTSCTDNHGIRPPPPEQYLTPLQQKEVCIRHLRARLKETVETLQDRDSEIDELRGQLSRMQEDWIEEECHRVEAQLALKEAQHEIQQLQEVVEVVRTSLAPSSDGQPDGPPPDTGVMHKCFQDIHQQNHKLETLLHSLEMAQAGSGGSSHRHQQGEMGSQAVSEGGGVMGVVSVQGVGSGMGITSAMGGGEGPAMVPAELEGGEGVGSGSAAVGPAMTSAMATATAPVIGGGGGGSSLSSCEGSPARSLTRSSTYTKLSEHAAPGDRSSCGSACGSVCGASAHGGGGGSAAGSVCGGSIHGGGGSGTGSICGGSGSICGSSVHGGRGSVGGGGGGSDSGSTAGLGEFACLSTEGTQDSGFVCCGDSQRASHTDLLLEAALLSKETASLLSSYSYSLPHSSSAYEHMVPLHYALGGPSGSASHPCLSHHHLYLHHLREQGIQTDCSTVAPMSAPAHGYGHQGNNDLDTIAEQRTFRSQACSPTSTWMSDEGEDEELDESVTTVSVTTMTATTTAPEPASLLLPADPTEPDLEPVALPLDPPSQHSLEKSVEQPPEQLTEQLSEDSLNQRMEEPSEEPEPLLTSRSCTCSCSSSSGPPPPVQVDKQRSQAHAGSKHRCLSDSTSKHRSHSYADSKRRAHSDSAYISRDHGLDTPPPQTCQPRGSGSPVSSLAHTLVGNGMTVVDLGPGEGEDGNQEGQEGGSAEQGAVATAEGGPEDGDSGPVVKSYWSRHFLVDLLAVAVPVVPTVAWLCHAPRREGQPLYHFGSLLRGCCTVALTSLRRGGGFRHYPAGSGGPPAQI